MGVVNFKENSWMNEDTKSIVDAIKHSGDATAEKIDGMQQSVSELAKSVYELAVSNTYLSKDVEAIKVEAKETNKRLTAIEPAAKTMSVITNIFLRWMIPVMLTGVVASASAYAFFK